MIATPANLQAVRGVAINVAAESIEPFIDDAEKQDVLPAIGAKLYFDVEANRDGAQYTELLFGGRYTSECGTLKYSRGLVTAVAYLAYARMLIFGDIQYTAFGAVLKTAQYSQKPGENDKIRAADAARKLGFAILDDVVEYARQTFDVGGSCNARPISRPKYISIKKKEI